MPTTTATDWPARRCSACTSDACRQGRDACPTPEACQVAGDDTERMPLTEIDRMVLWVIALLCVLFAAWWVPAAVRWVKGLL